jgi:hypothetical protein
MRTNKRPALLPCAAIAALALTACAPTYQPTSLVYVASAKQIQDAIVLLVTDPHLIAAWNSEANYDMSIGAIAPNYVQVDFRKNASGVATEVTLNFVAALFGSRTYSSAPDYFTAVFTLYESGSVTYVTGNGRLADEFIREVFAFLDKRFTRSG